MRNPLRRLRARGDGQRSESMASEWVHSRPFHRVYNCDTNHKWPRRVMPFPKSIWCPLTLDPQGSLDVKMTVACYHRLGKWCHQRIGDDTGEGFFVRGERLTGHE